MVMAMGRARAWVRLWLRAWARVWVRMGAHGYGYVLAWVRMTMAMTMYSPGCAAKSAKASLAPEGITGHMGVTADSGIRSPNRLPQERAWRRTIPPGVKAEGGLGIHSNLTVG